MNLVLSTIEQGLIYAVLALGVYITYRRLNIADMTVEGTFPLGGLFTAFLLLKDVNPVLAMVLTFLVGVIPGLVSALLSIKLNIIPLLAGILTMTMLYSVNLRINGKPNVPFTKSDTIYDLLDTGNEYIDKIIILLIMVIFFKLLLDWFFSTKMGYMLTVTGDNEKLVYSLGEDPNKYKIIGLGLANGFAALSGSLFAQSVNFADTQMGVGTMVISLASIIIGFTIFRNREISGTSRVIMGAIIYKIIGTIAIELGLNPNDLKMINALIVVVFIAYNNSYESIKAKLTGNKEWIYVRN